MTTLTERIDTLPATRRKKVEERTKALLIEEMSLQELRKAREQTQVRVAQKLGINQENVSRLERRSDLLDFHPRRVCRGVGRKTELGGGVSRPAANRTHRHCGS